MYKSFKVNFTVFPFLILIILIGLVPISSFQETITENDLFSLTKILFGPLFLVICWYKAINAESYLWNTQTTLIFCFAGTLLISSLLSENVQYSIVSLRKYFSVILLYFISLQLITSWKRIFITLWAIIITCGFSSIMGLIQKISGAKSMLGSSGAFEDPTRNTGLSSVDPNTFATQILVGLLLAVVLLLTEKNRKVLMVLGGLVICMLMSIMFTFSRGTSLALAFGLILLGLFYRKSIKPSQIVFLLIMGVVGLFFIPGEYWERISTIGDFKTDLSLMRRLSYHILGLQLFITHPLTGIGPGNFPAYFINPAYRFITDTFSGGRFLHNLFLSVLVETGGIGFTFFIAILIRSYLSILRAYRIAKQTNDLLALRITKALIVAFIAFIFSNIFLPAEHAKYLWLFFAIAASIDIITTRMIHEKTTN